MRKSVSGFTIVEILIVIVVIAILATISTIAYSGFNERARASAIISDLKTTEKAFRLHFAARGYTKWPVEYIDLPHNPSIQYFIDSEDGFKDFMATAPGQAGISWEYDNNANHKDLPCGTDDDIDEGANIAIKPLDREVSIAIDKTLDNGDGKQCGSFRWYESGSKIGNAYYNIEPNGAAQL